MKTSRGFIESVVTPVLIVGMTTLGGWGAWVSIASYEANRHISEYEAMTTELHEVADKLIDVEKSFITLHAEVTSTTGANKRLLERILEVVAP